MRRLIFGLALLATPIPAAADIVPLSEIDEETRVYIQRGNHGYDVECYEYVLEMIKRENPGFKPSNYYVQFDDIEVDGIAVGAMEAGQYYTCEGGVLKSWDSGESQILRKF